MTNGNRLEILSKGNNNRTLCTTKIIESSLEIVPLNCELGSHWHLLIIKLDYLQIQIRKNFSGT